MFTSRTKTCVGCTRPYFHFIDMSAQVPFWRVGHFWAFFWSLERQVALVFVFHLCPRSLFYWWFNGHLDWLKFNIPIFRAGSLGSPGSRLPAIHLSTHPSIHFVTLIPAILLYHSNLTIRSFTFSQDRNFLKTPRWVWVNDLFSLPYHLRNN